MVVRWQADNGAAISSYDLRYRSDSTGDFIDGPQNVIQTRATLRELSPDTEYEIQVRASNATGDSEWSQSGMVRTPTRIASGRFSLALDLDDAEGDQFMSFLSVFPDPDSVVSIQVFGKNLKAISANDISVRFEYDAMQVAYEGFKRGPVISGTSALSGKNFAHIGMTLPDRATRVDSGLIGTLRFRTRDAFLETEIRVVQVKFLQGGQGQSETLPMFLSVALHKGVAPVVTVPSPDFDGNGTVGISDFTLFVDVFGAQEGQERYDARYDLDADGEIGISDFTIFVDSFGKEVAVKVEVDPVLVFTSLLPVLRFVEENTPSGQPIGEPVSAMGAGGDVLTYSLWGVDADYFAIDANTGQLETSGTINFEQRNWYSPIVRVRDGKGGIVSVVVSIAIIDVIE